MMKCKYCNNNVNDNGTYCSNCGSIITNESKNSFINTFISIFKGIINPNSFVRNSKVFEISKTGIIAGIIVILNLVQALIFSKSTVGRISNYFIGGLNSSILISLITLILSVGIYSLVDFIAVKIKKDNSSYIQILNFEIYSYLFMAVISFIGIILNFMTLHLLAGLIIIYGAILYTLIVIQGIKTLWKFNTTMATLTYVIRVVAMYIVSLIIMQIL